MNLEFNAINRQTEIIQFLSKYDFFSDQLMFHQRIQKESAKNFEGFLIDGNNLKIPGDLEQKREWDEIEKQEIGVKNYGEERENWYKEERNREERNRGKKNREEKKRGDKEQDRIFKFSNNFNVR